MEQICIEDFGSLLGPSLNSEQLSSRGSERSLEDQGLETAALFMKTRFRETSTNDFARFILTPPFLYTGGR